MTSSEKPYSIQLAEITAKLFNNCNDKESRIVADYDVSIVEFKCIRILAKQKSITVNQLAKTISLTSSRITRITDRLVAKNLAQRTSGEKDRRVFYLSLTPKGKIIAEKLIKNHNRIHEEIMDNISTENHRQMIVSLKLLNDAVEKWLSTQ